MVSLYKPQSNSKQTDVVIFNIIICGGLWWYLRSICWIQFSNDMGLHYISKKQNKLKHFGKPTSSISELFYEV